MTQIRLISGVLFDLIDPDPEAITIEVIASALAKQCRFAGHTKRFYSVAEHCVRGSYFCEDPLAFLLHDASEAFCVDLPTPLKRLLPEYAVVENRIQDIISEKFGVNLDQECVHKTDKLMLWTEQAELVPGSQPDGEPLRFQHLASETGNDGRWRRRYVERFYELTARLEVAA